MFYFYIFCYLLSFAYLYDGIMDSTLQAYEVRGFWPEKKPGKIFSCLQRPAKSPLKEHCIYVHESRVCVFTFDRHLPRSYMDFFIKFPMKHFALRLPLQFTSCLQEDSMRLCEKRRMTLLLGKPSSIQIVPIEIVWIWRIFGLSFSRNFCCLKE